VEQFDEMLPVAVMSCSGSLLVELGFRHPVGSKGKSMSVHKYHVGQTVSFGRRSGLFNKAVGEYSVTRLMPNDESLDEPQYRLKSSRETHDRFAKESELSGAGEGRA
jgi:hypothetical protein